MSSGWSALYRLCAGVGMPEPELHYEVEGPSGNPHVADVAWPAWRLALALEGRPLSALRRKRWDIIELNERLLAPTAEVLACIDETAAALNGRPHAVPVGLSITPPNPEWDDIDPGWRALYRLLQAAGVPRDGAQLNFSPPIGSSLNLAWPDKQVAVLLSAGGRHPLADDGWKILRAAPQSLAAASMVLELVDKVAFGREIRRAEEAASLTVSATEERLLRELMKLGVPMPDRNTGFGGGEWPTTTADFCWHGPRVAVFVDGLYFHGGADFARDVAEAAQRWQRPASEVEKRARNASVADMAKRRRVAAEGWVYVQVSDVEIDEDGDAAMIAGEIAEIIARREAESVQAQPTAS